MMQTETRSSSSSIAPQVTQGRLRLLLAVIGLLGGLVIIVGLSLTIGSVSIAWADLVPALLRQGNPTYQIIVWDLYGCLD